jgi:hypothetical protein
LITRGRPTAPLGAKAIKKRSADSGLLPAQLIRRRIPPFHIGMHSDMHQRRRNMFKRLCLISLSATALIALSACVVVPPYATSPRHAHDRDRDGVPNRHDRDRDGDGVPNRYDRRPDNPYRR